MMVLYFVADKYIGGNANPPLWSPRVLLDRAHTDFHNVFHGLDREPLDLPPSPPPSSIPRAQAAADKFASTSETNTSDRSSSLISSTSSSSTDLSQILLNIKACRWRHFRPRTLPLHKLDNAHPLFRRLSRGAKRTASSSGFGGQPGGAHPGGRLVPNPVAGELTPAIT